MTHGDTIIYSYSIEFCSEAAEFLDPCLDLLTDLVEMHMSWDKLSKGVDDCNDRFAELAILHSIGPPESSSSGHFRADCTLTASEFFHSKKNIVCNYYPVALQTTYINNTPMDSHIYIPITRDTTMTTTCSPIMTPFPAKVVMLVCKLLIIDSVVCFLT